MRGCPKIGADNIEGFHDVVARRHGEIQRRIFAYCFRGILARRHGS
jgi:hypothetical protein